MLPSCCLHYPRPHLQPCVFRVDYVLETGARAFGTVFVNDGKDNLAMAVASAGWAKVRDCQQLF